MSVTSTDEKNSKQVESLYEESDFWHVNTGNENIHAKRMPGKFRKLKWLASSTWLLFLFVPYLRWDGQQAILFDIPDRQYHFFSITIFPQDIWLLSLILLFFAMLLAAVTAVAGRIYCGYFCFQTIWTDIFTWIEEKLEGSPQKRRKLDQAPMSWSKFKIKLIKHSAWILIGFITGFSFTAWFTDVYQLWVDVLTLNAHYVSYFVITLFTVGTYVLAGFMREQACFWLCPYARIQGVMADRYTVLPTYDIGRGEKRGRIRKGEKLFEGQGDCIDCGQCVAVCPTGVDIRRGMQEGCITCGLCFDACDSIMDKINLPKGLIRYASLDEMEGNPRIPLHKHYRVLVYGTILLISLFGIIYGLLTISPLNFKVLHERQPLYVKLSNGDIQNKYYLKVFNKTDKNVKIKITAPDLDPKYLVIDDSLVVVKAGELSTETVYIRLPKSMIKSSKRPVKFQIEEVSEQIKNQLTSQSVFFSSMH
jgi:cytochrome c oxidase accessory protein FixG